MATLAKKSICMVKGKYIDKRSNYRDVKPMCGIVGFTGNGQVADTGIIENYTELKEKLLKYGYTFYS